MANFIQILYKIASTGQAVQSLYLTADEVPNGVTRNESPMIVANITTLGRGRTFTKADGIEFSFDIVIDEAATIGKLDTIQTNIGNGYICDVYVLTGVSAYNPLTNAVIYSTAKAIIYDAVVMEFDNTWRKSVAGGQLSRLPVAIRIRQGASNALPLSADWVGV
jgi:hypothetical protein